MTWNAYEMSWCGRVGTVVGVSLVLWCALPWHYSVYVLFVLLYALRERDWMLNDLRARQKRQSEAWLEKAGRDASSRDRRMTRGGESSALVLREPLGHWPGESKGANVFVARCTCGYPPLHCYVESDNGWSGRSESKTMVTREWKNLAEGEYTKYIPQKQIVNAVLENVKNAAKSAASMIPGVGPLAALGVDAGFGWLITSVMGSLFPSAPAVKDPVLEQMEKISADITSLHTKVDDILKRMKEYAAEAKYVHALDRLSGLLEAVKKRRTEWKRTLVSPPGSDDRRPQNIVQWSRNVNDRQTGLLALLESKAYGRSEEGIYAGALYGTRRTPGLLDAWEQLSLIDSYDVWTRRAEQTMAETKAGADVARMVWRTESIARATPSVFMSQPEVDIIWGEWTQWLQLQAMCIEFIVEASHVPVDDPTSFQIPVNKPAETDTLRVSKTDLSLRAGADVPKESGIRPAIDIELDVKIIKDEIDYQLETYMPRIPAGNNTYQYLVHVGSNLVWGLYPPGGEPNTQEDGVDASLWRLPTPAELTYLLLQLGCPAPYDTTVDSVLRAKGTDQSIMFFGPEGPLNIVFDMFKDPRVDKIDETARSAYEQAWSHLPGQWTIPSDQMNKDAFWPRLNVTKSAWQQGAGFLTKDSTLLSFEVGRGYGYGKDAKSAHVSGVYRSDLNWIVRPGSSFPPHTPGTDGATKNNQPLYRMLVRTYDTRARTPPRLNATETTDWKSGDILVHEGIRWKLDVATGQRRWLTTESVVRWNGDVVRERPATKAQLADIAIGPPMYYESYYQSRRFHNEVQQVSNPTIKEGDVVNVPGYGIWKLYAGRRHWISTFDVLEDLKTNYKTVPTKTSFLALWPIGFPFVVRPLPPAVAGLVKSGDVITSSDQSIWYIQGGEKHYFDGTAYGHAGYPTPRAIPLDQLRLIPTGEAL